MGVYVIVTTIGIGFAIAIVGLILVYKYSNNEDQETF